MTQMKDQLEFIQMKAALKTMFPHFEDMTEFDLRIVLTEMENGRAIRKCPYTGETLTAENRFMMYDIDYTLKVGTHDHLQLRALRDGSQIVLMKLVYEPLNARYEALKAAREQEEKARADREQIRQEAITKISKVARMLRKVNEVDGLNPEPGPFHAMLEQIARAQGATDEELNIYYEAITTPASKDPAA